MIEQGRRIKKNKDVKSQWEVSEGITRHLDELRITRITRHQGGLFVRFRKNVVASELWRVSLKPDVLSEMSFSDTEASFTAVHVLYTAKGRKSRLLFNTTTPWQREWLTWHEMHNMDHLILHDLATVCWYVCCEKLKRHFSFCISSSLGIACHVDSWWSPYVVLLLD